MEQRRLPIRVLEEWRVSDGMAQVGKGKYVQLESDSMQFAEQDVTGNCYRDNKNGQRSKTETVAQCGVGVVSSLGCLFRRLSSGCEVLNPVF